MSESKVIIGILAGTALLIMGGVFFAGKLNKPSNIIVSTQAQAVVASQTKDWGDVGINSGKITAEFPINNAGSDILKLYNITTSCTCTTAQVIVNGISSPLFKMGDRSSYVALVPPGATATLKVVFDPAFHGPNGVGPVSRLALVETNDSRNPKLEFSMSGTVVK